MNPNLQDKSISSHPKNKDIYTKDYNKCKDQCSRERMAANIASDNGRCWWIYNFLRANKYVRPQ